MTVSISSQSSADAEAYAGPRRVGLLISVRNGEEAAIALRGGADLIDVKEPNRGALGAADQESIREVVERVAGEVPLSAAMGELLDYASILDSRLSNTSGSESDGLSREGRGLPKDVTFAKFGLAGCQQVPTWPQLWQQALGSFPRSVSPVAVVYADWLAATAPPPEEVLDVAPTIGCQAILVDTFDKHSGDLFEHLSVDTVADLVEKSRQQNLLVVLAGSLTESTLQHAAALAPDYVALRGAACDGNRRGKISLSRVKILKELLQSSNPFNSK